MPRRVDRCPPRRRSLLTKHSRVGFYATGNTQVKGPDVATDPTTACLVGDSGTGTTRHFFADPASSSTAIASGTIGGPSDRAVASGQQAGGHHRIDGVTRQPAWKRISGE